MVMVRGEFEGTEIGQVEKKNVKMILFLKNFHFIILTNGREVKNVM